MYFVWISEIQQLFMYAALTDWFLGALAKLRKAIINFVVSLRLSLRMEQLGSQ